jgi:1,4-dihydroxy-2-naphthoate octaprenyltransferase
VISSGALGETVARNAARVLLALAAVAIGAVARWGGEGAGAGATALCAALALAWTYSAPPVRLHSRGLGEATTAVVVTGLVPLVAFLLQQGGGGRGGLARLGLALVPLMGLQFGMLLAIEFPDAAGDAAVGKRTLVVRLGARRAGAVYRALLVATYGSIPLLALGGLPPLAAMAAALSAPIAAWQFHRLGAGAWGDPRAWERVAFRAVAMLVATSAAELSAFVWLGHRA